MDSISAPYRLGIPKGSIFYWFGNKDGLYLYLVDLSVKRFVEAFADAAREWPNEILARLRILITSSSPSWGVSAAGDLLLDPIRQTIAERALPSNTRDVAIVLAALDDAGSIGAAALVWQDRS